MTFRKYLGHAALLAAVALAATAPMAATAADKPASEPLTANAAGQSPMARFQHDLVNVLAVRGEAEPLLGAALLASTLPDLPKYSNFHSLITRATKAPGAGPAQWWVQLADCNLDRPCPNASALAELKKSAPDNAATWLVALGDAARKGDEKAALTALSKAAHAKRFDDYGGTAIQALTKASLTLPPPPKLYRTNGVATSASGVRTLLIFGLPVFQPMAGFQATAALCKEKAKVKSVRNTCLRLAKVLVVGGSPLARSLGLHLQETLSDNAKVKARAKTDKRNLEWQVQSFGTLVLASQQRQDIAVTLLKVARKGGTRMSIALDTMRMLGTPRRAPEGWQPAKDKS